MPSCRASEVSLIVRRVTTAITVTVSLVTAAPVAHGQQSIDNALQGAISAYEAGDVAGAERTLRPLAAGDPEAAAWLGATLLKRGDKAAVTEAIRLLQNAAGAGNARAKYLLGFQHAIGQGVPSDLTRAAQLFQEAATAGIGRAAYNLGVLYAKGRGVAQDPTQALRWYERAAQAGDPYGAYAMARATELSPQATTRAAEMAQAYRAAAEQGHLPAAVRYGVLLAEGRGVRKDPAEAERFLRHAAGNGYAEADVIMGDLAASTAMGSRGEPARAAAASAIGWYTSAANKGVALAQFKLANALFAGAGVERDMPKAEQWYERAARQGFDEAQYVLGVWKSGGVASAKDPVAGYKWLLLAERQGNTNAGKVRARAAEKLSSSEISQAQADAAAFRAQPERPLGRPDDEAPPLKPMAPKR
ncbi:sel1 repeat family protein [Vineibacter terrae]|uniref:Sel1 repeat family protein n=1 Tax=Vineibacter terrae TaxID=2586908 RepID=A0A5C8PKY5_9HYPH|nr:tetratricopeptide repeat protein [Vineibacter terrae]TXL74017.1 sel1 repeat family protein [Vineibacter terrae]